ncbi:MAG: anaerobic ribonucleoside-triphosphate reductase activating protein, partial [Oscillospiraceae bacterium]|nr:anaerobic ribonucleoside-triphosphate reductase activating protein [Oscillospiraceae bacterium]
MIINGLQKLTLLDFPGRTACTVFLGGCNFRCPFCHNASLVLRPASLPRIAPHELFSFLEKRRGLLDGVAVTGGEPTLQKDLPELLERIKELGFAVKLDTNGSDPAMLRRIIDGGLADYAAMDIKSSPEGYAAAVGLPDIDLGPVFESADLLME